MRVKVKNDLACVGCRLCELICSLTHEGVFRPSISRIFVVKKEEEGLDYPITCNQCDEAPCIDVCPTGALSKNDETNAIQISETDCTGCFSCVEACPLDAINPRPREGRVEICGLCGGEPQCVKYCPVDALEISTPLSEEDERYLRESSLNRRL